MSKLITISSGTAVVLLIASATGLVFVVTKLDPGSKQLNPLLFYLSLFIFVGSLLFLIGLSARRMFGVRELVRQHIVVSLRQGVWFAFLVVASFVLLALGLFNWINAVLLVFCLIFLESYFLFK